MDQVNDYVILTFNGGVYHIDEHKHTLLTEASLDDTIQTNEGAGVKVSTIAEILPKAEFYKQYPNKVDSRDSAQQNPMNEDLVNQLRDPIFLAQIMEFKKLLQNLQETTPLEKSLDYYGDLLLSDEKWEAILKREPNMAKIAKNRGWTAKTRKLKSENGYINNPVIGIVHFSEVKWAEEQGLIGRYPGGNWFIAVDKDPTTQKINAQRFNEYRKKKKAVEFLRNRDHKDEEQSKLTTEL